MSWVEVPDDVKMPETTTYKRAVKRQRAKFDSYWKASHSEETPKQKYNSAMSDYHREQKRLTRVNKFRAKRGLRPLAMPGKPKKSSLNELALIGGLRAAMIECITTSKVLSTWTLNAIKGLE